MHLPETNPWDKEMWSGICQILHSWSHETEAHGLSMWEKGVTRTWKRDYVQAKWKCPLEEIYKEKEFGC